MWPKKKIDQYQEDLDKSVLNNSWHKTTEEVKEEFGESIYTMKSGDKLITVECPTYNKCLYCQEDVIRLQECEHSNINIKAHKSCCMKANKGNGS